MTTTTIDLLRHGECEDGHCYRGSTDVKLSAIGHQSMARSVQYFVDDANTLPWQFIATSPLQRCATFATSLASQHQLPLSSHFEFKEMHFGDWEGQSIDHIWQTQSSAVDQWYRDPVQFPPPNGEAADIFSQRVVAGFYHLIEKNAGQHGVLVAHGGVIRVLLAHCLSMPLLEMHRLDVPYACVSRIQVITEIKPASDKHSVSSSSVSGAIENPTQYLRLIAHNMTLSLCP